MTKRLITIIVMSLLCLSLKAENGGRTGISLNFSYKSVADSPYRDPSSGMGTIDFFGSSSNSSSPELNPVSNYYIISLGMNRDVPLFGAVSLYYRIMADYNLFPLCSYQNPDGNDFISFSVPINAKYTFEISSGLKAFAIAGFDNNIAISGIGFGLFDVKYKSFKKAQPNRYQLGATAGAGIEIQDRTRLFVSYSRTLLQHVLNLGDNASESKNTLSFGVDLFF